MYWVLPEYFTLSARIHVDKLPELGGGSCPPSPPRPVRLWYWFHHNRVAAPDNQVGSKDDVRVVPSPPSTAVERAGKLGVVNQAQSLVICPVLFQFAVSVSRSIAPCRTVALEVPMITCCWSPTAVSGWWNEKRSPDGL